MKSEPESKKEGTCAEHWQGGRESHGEGVSMSWVPSLNISGKGPG